MKEDMQKEQSEYLLKWALEEQLKQDEEMNRYPSEIEIEPQHVFSQEHEERIKTIWKMAEKEETYHQRRRKKLQMAAGIAAMLCISSVTVMQSEAFRVPVLNFFSEIKEKSTFFGVKEEICLTEKFQDYEPQYVPEGFSVLEVREETGSFVIRYINDENERKYSYHFFLEPINFALDTENCEVYDIEIKGNIAHVIQKGEDFRVLFNDDQKSIYVVGNIELEEILKIFESIQ